MRKCISTARVLCSSVPSADCTLSALCLSLQLLLALISLLKHKDMEPMSSE